VKINNTSSIQRSHSTIEPPNLAKDGFLSKSKSLSCGEDWGSDDDSHFLDIEAPNCSNSSDSHFLATDKNKTSLSLLKNNQIDPAQNLTKETTKETQVRKFPGPAGVLLPIKVSICFLLVTFLKFYDLFYENL